MATATRAKSGHRRRQLTFEDLRGLRAEGYIRESSRDQRDGFGPDVQRRFIEQFAVAYGLILGQRWYTEFISSFRRWDKRTVFQQIVGDAHVDQFDVLLVHKTSRFGRNQEECIRYKRQLQELGKVVVFVSQGIISGNRNDFVNERINETMDEGYSLTLSDNVTDGLREKFEHGLANGDPPLGYTSEKLASGKRERKVPDRQGRGGDPKAGGMAALLELLRSYARGGFSYEALADHLNAQGYRTRLGRPFAVTSVARVLENRFYAGKVVWHPGEPDEEVRDGSHEVPPEVRDLWLACQEVRRQRGHVWSRGPRRRHRSYPFSGVLTCDGCGARYKGLASYKGPEHLRQRLVHRRPSCGIKPLSQRLDAMGQQFAARVLPFLAPGEDFVGRVTRALLGPQEHQTQQQAVARLEQALERLRKEHQWGDLTDAQYLKERDELRRQLQAAREALPAVSLPDLRRAADLLGNLPSLWQHPGVSDAQRQQLVLETFAEIRIRGRELVAVRPKPRYLPHFAHATLWNRENRGCPTNPRVNSAACCGIHSAVRSLL